MPAAATAKAALWPYALARPPAPSNIPPKYRVTTTTQSVRFCFLNTESMGMPAVPVGSPSSK